MNTKLTLKHQDGIALPLTLIILLVMTLLGVASLNSSTLEEQMAANTRLREVAFNAAETTLRFGELVAAELGESNEIRRTNLPAQTFRLFEPRPGVNGWPVVGVASHAGNTCNAGYCIPLQYHLEDGTTPTLERWEDDALDVWNDTTKHLTYTNYSTSGLADDGVFEAPKFIIEFLGNFPDANDAVPESPATQCTGAAAGSQPVGDWPFCINDPAFFRITARAISGSGARQSVVTLQSTIKVP